MPTGARIGATVRTSAGAGAPNLHAHASAGTFPVVHSEEGDERAIEGETLILAQAPATNGPARRRELSHRVRSKYWGPGQFRRAVSHGVQTRRIVEEHGVLKVATPEHAIASGRRRGEEDA